MNRKRWARSWTSSVHRSGSTAVPRTGAPVSHSVSGSGCDRVAAWQCCNSPQRPSCSTVRPRHWPVTASQPPPPASVVTEASTPTTQSTNTASRAGPLSVTTSRTCSPFPRVSAWRKNIGTAPQSDS